MYEKYEDEDKSIQIVSGGLTKYPGIMQKVN
jgi:hypothetical protein